MIDAPALLAADVNAPVHRRVDALEVDMRKLPQVTMEPRHFFAHGLYAREITIPAGTLLTGKIHLEEHLNILSQGEISVWSEAEGVRRFKAPFTFVAQPGTRRVGYAITDCVWTTIHANPDNVRDEATLEERLILKHEAAPTINGGSPPCLGSQQP